MRNHPVFERFDLEEDSCIVAAHRADERYRQRRQLIGLAGPKDLDGFREQPHDSAQPDSDERRSCNSYVFETREVSSKNRKSA
ncbi:MAG TPA: hypothetical protein VN087_02705 [Verrucomicrobiae bacterium]|nr:hypothetical protein [Verrucomicrobiae bacterium]